MDINRVKHILAVRNDRFGEFLLNIPAFRALKETFVNARLTVVVHPYVGELAGCVPYIDEVVEWNGQSRSLREKAALIGILRRKKIDIALMLNPSKEFNIYTFMAGIPQRIGYSRKWPFMLTGTISDEKHLAKRHEVEYNLQLVSLVGAMTKDSSLFLSVPDVPPAVMAGEYGIPEKSRIIVVHPFTSDPVKQWPFERFAKLAEVLVQDLPVTVAFIGGKEEAARSRKCFGRVFGKRIVDLTGKTGLCELAGFLKQCDLLVSGDSGPVHLACCVKTPVIALFRSDLPGKIAHRWGPWGPGNTVIEKNSLRKITVNEVVQKVKESWSYRV
ncbi:MAG: glycosyltransferase family 9 protein [Candidatus Omnitrophica bacterium]|nr:glycosyltransferase family 9 protein [Candidatus Omnitrophota bacterium]